MGLEQAAGRDADVADCKLYGRDQHVALANDHVRAVAGKPGLLFRGVRIVLALPLRRGHPAYRLARKVYARRTAEAELFNDVLHGVFADGLTVEVEVLCDLVEDRVAGDDNARAQVDRAMAVEVPAVLRVLFAEARPRSRARPCGRRRRESVLHARKAGERLVRRAAAYSPEMTRLLSGWYSLLL